MTTPLLSPENNRSSIENNRGDLINSTLFRKKNPLLYLRLIFDVLALSMLILTYRNRLLLIIMKMKQQLSVVAEVYRKVFFTVRN